MADPYSAFAKLIAGSGVTGASDWPALVAALEERGDVIVFHDDDQGEALTPTREQVDRMFALAGTRVKLPAGADAWFDGRTHDGYTTWAIQRQIGKALSAYRAAAIQLDLRDEARFAMTVVPWRVLDDAKALARAAGGRVISRSPAKPIARPMRAAKPPPANLKRVKVKGWHHVYQRGTADGICVSDNGGKAVFDIIDVSTWPPQRRRLCDFHCESIGFTRDGGHVAFGTRGDRQTPREQRECAFEWSDGTVVPPLPKGVDIRKLGVLGDAVVVMPTEPTYRGKHATRPFVLHGKAWKPLDVPAVVVAKGTKKDQFPSFAVHGFARTATDDVVLWQDGGYVQDGKKLVRRFELGACTPYDELSNVPDGDGFFVCSQETIVEARPGAAPVQRLPINRIYRIAAGLDGAVVATVVRVKSSDPALVVWWPARREYAKVPAKVFHLRGTDDFIEHGVAAASRLAWGYESISEDLRAVSWDALVALPRIAEPASRIRK